VGAGELLKSTIAFVYLVRNFLNLFRKRPWLFKGLDYKIHYYICLVPLIEVQEIKKNKL
jgi:hypothetical protein